MPLSWIYKFVKLESFGGFLLVAATVLALICANTPIADSYYGFLNTLVKVQIGDFSLGKPLRLWINDGLMTLFFLLIGLEVKREIVEGQLSNIKHVTLPIFGAIGGMVVPAFIYIFFNWHAGSLALRGWAIPVATDVAFVLGILAILGKRVPIALKLFIMALAIFDDIAAILVIALFYAGDLSYVSLFGGLIITLILVFLNKSDILYMPIYILLGIILWFMVLKSGVHATLAGIVFALTIPLKSKKKATNQSPLRHMEHVLHPWVAYLILPVFAFANAGVPLLDLNPKDLLSSVPIGIALGLFLGKQFGVFAFSWVAIKTGLARLPNKLNWGHIYSGGMLCGIGFTMSLFISALAFEQHTSAHTFADSSRLGILVGSFLSAVFGFLLLKHVTKEDIRIPAGESAGNQF